MGAAVAPSPSLSQTGGLKLADAHVYRSPGKYARCDRDPRPSGAGIPTGQEHPLAVPETAETKVPPVYEKVAMVDPMSELVDVGMPDVNPMIAVLIAAFEAVTFAVCKAVTFASFEAVTIFPFVAVVQVSIAAFLIVDRSALRALVSATELTARTTVKCRCP